MVDISDALSEQDKVKFTVHTKVGFLHDYCNVLRASLRFYILFSDHSQIFQEGGLHHCPRTRGVCVAARQIRRERGICWHHCKDNNSLESTLNLDTYHVHDCVQDVTLTSKL